MRPEEVKSWLKREPFIPFRMVLSNGRTFEVQHPEMVMLGRTWVVVGDLVLVDDFPLPENYVTIALVHINLIEPLRSPSPPTTA
jgi:hypothetical protein